jgi:RHH-type proline utilization regulon transcriptional repressor/proline dehydrogenase/delta 1-pyrroline-5-carboxylate dehydrogenase
VIDWAKERGRRVAVRLVKGAYWDTEVIEAKERGWAVPVWERKAESDVAFERLTGVLMDHARWVTPVIASHNVRSLANALECASERGLGRDQFELQTLYGMAEPLKKALARMGYRVRDYVPVGEVVPGMAYLVRRLLENTSNESWLRRQDMSRVDMNALLVNPCVTLAAQERAERKLRAKEGAKRGVHGVKRDVKEDVKEDAQIPRVFSNEPPRDYTVAAQRAQMQRALNDVKQGWIGEGRGDVRCVIGAEEVETGEWQARYNPAAPDMLIGRAVMAGVAEADKAVAAARQAWEGGWRDATVGHRVGLLREVARSMRAERDLLAALMVLEVGKGWQSADADVCEAIDFLEYYAFEMERLGVPRKLGAFLGEDNAMSYQPKGVVAVIAPWNFPLAILTGMVSAALVTGNTVVMKPAEQSCVVAKHLMRLFKAAQVGSGVLNLVTGAGEVVGARLGAHEGVDLVAFTGSQAVGLQLWAAAGRTDPRQRTLKRVICELGGKNAVIIDDDADMDEAVLGVMEAAFGFQGQKCSACSRVIVVGEVYDAFVRRLTAALGSLKVGAPEDPAVGLGPVVDEEAQRRILAALTRAATDGRVIQPLPIPPTQAGWYVPASLVLDISPHAEAATEELFGPVLCVLRAPTFEAALVMAQDSPYALTGGLYSRRPSHIEAARRTWRVGNLYINRPCTGALVWRQPFGGGGRSGVGSKAGGPDYLLQWMDPKVVTENTIRRGFAPQT